MAAIVAMELQPVKSFFCLTSNMSPEAAAVAKQISELENRLKALLKSSQPDEKAIRPVRISLRDSYEKLLLLDHKLATESQVEQSLWKLVFYKRIEDYRKRHSKMCSAIQDSDKKERATEALKALNESFTRFLDESKTFYFSLLQKLLNICGICLPTYSDAVLSGSSAFSEETVWSCHRCLVYLGDLERYAQLYVEGGRSDWTAPKKHYEAAVLLLPHVGNPHNQIAVLATYKGDDLEGVYSYGRALLCSSPFATARDNLSILFEKNRQNCLYGRDAGQLGKKKGDARKKRSADFCSRFVRLLGVLWTKIDIDEYRMIESALLTEFVTLLDSGDLDGKTLIMIVASSIFIVNYLEQIWKEDDHSSAERKGINCFDSALGLAFKIFCKVCVSARAREDQISALCIFTDWLQYHMHFLNPSALDNHGLSKDVRVARQAFIENLVDFLNLSFSEGFKEAAEPHPLPEDLELIGFLPLANAHQEILSQAARGALSSLREESALLDAATLKNLRFQKLEEFAYRLSSGPRPVLFYDSQSREYSVEGGGGVFNIVAPIGADSVQSQPRGKAGAGRGAAGRGAAAAAGPGCKDTAGCRRLRSRAGVSQAG